MLHIAYVNEYTAFIENKKANSNLMIGLEIQLEIFSDLINTGYLANFFFFFLIFSYRGYFTVTWTRLMFTR